MLDVGFSEILLTSAIALIVLGPERLPKVARQVGNWMGRARAMARQLSEQLEREVSADELLKIQSKPKTVVNPSVDGANAPSNSTFDASYTAARTVEAASATPAAAGIPTPGAPVPQAPIEPVYGLDASATTPEAMHAHEPPGVATPVTDPRTADSQPTTIDQKSPA